MPKIEPPYYPIIYVRGYAGNDDEIEDTVADPYMGFNLGATKFRQTWTGSVRRHYFESPLYRLAKDYGYTDVYSQGQFMPGELDVPCRSVVIYRYYDEPFLDDLSGNPTAIDSVSGKQREIEDFADGLGKLILKLRDRICTDDADRQAFRVYLVGHSMGGLVCRCFLQNPRIATPEAKRLVDKVFTYATPHNGIELEILGNVPSFFSANNVNNFNRKRMQQYLGLPPGADDVSNLNGAFDADRFFCLVGTNSKDYTVAGGWSRRLTGPMSDGLVRIVNATVHDQPRKDGPKTEAPRAFVHRSHSGHYGIVNSEEGYQNLVRFLFGDLRVDGVLDLDEITLPPGVQAALDNKQQIRASYHFEVIVRVRGFDWDLHRRTAAEESAVFRAFDEIFPREGRPRNPHLFSAYLSTNARVKKRRPSLAFAIELGVLVPEYEVDGFLWRDQHFKGSYLFRDTITIEATPQAGDDGSESYKVRYGLDSRTPNRATRPLELNRIGDAFACQIPVESGTRPGMKGTLRILIRSWT